MRLRMQPILKQIEATLQDVYEKEGTLGLRKIEGVDLTRAEWHQLLTEYVPHARRHGEPFLLRFCPRVEWRPRHYSEPLRATHVFDFTVRLNDHA